MFIGLLEYGKVVIFSAKRQYSESPVLFQYSDCLSLNITFDEAECQIELIKQMMPLLKTDSYCDGPVLKEIKL